jgi:hypothetical protein
LYVMPIRRSPGCKCCGGIATVSGNVLGCNSIGLAGAVVRFGPISGTDIYGVLTANSSGHYSGDISVPSPGTTVHFYGSPPTGALYATRFLPGGDNSSVISPGDNVTLPNVNMSAAVGYHCMRGLQCAIPVLGTLHATDPLFGAFTWVFGANGKPNSWSAVANPSYSGVAGCPGQGSIAFGWRWDDVPEIDWVSAGGGCPSNSSINVYTGNPGFGLGAVQGWPPGNAVITITSCFPLSVSISIPTLNIYNCSRIYGVGTVVNIPFTE